MPRRPKRADGEAESPVNGAAGPPSSPSEPAHNGANSAPQPPPKKRAVFARVEGADSRAPAPDAADTTVEDADADQSLGDQSGPGEQTLPIVAQPVEALATRAGGPELVPDRGLYAVLGLDPSVSDAEIQTTYRRQAARLLGSGGNENQALRQLNVAYEVLGNHVRRAEYDRLRLVQLLSPGPPPPIGHGRKVIAGPTRRTRPRHVVQPRYAGLPDVLVVLMVVGLAVLAGALLIPRLSINLSALNALQNVLPLTNSSRRVIDATVTPAPVTVVPTPTALPGLAARFAGSSVSVSNPQPAQNTNENVVVRLQRDGKPAANFDVWATVQYRTTEERWPPTGFAKTDASGTATIAFNIGAATPNYPVTIRVFAQVDDQQLSWSTTFTPR